MPDELVGTAAEASGPASEAVLPVRLPAAWTFAVTRLAAS